MGLFENISQRLKRKQLDDMEQYRIFVSRLATLDESEIDKLNELLPRIGKTLAEAEADAIAWSTIEGLKPLAADAEAREAVRREAFDRLQSFEAETKQIMEERSMARQALEADKGRKQSDARECHAAREKIERLTRQHFHLFPNDPIAIEWEQHIRRRPDLFPDHPLARLIQRETEAAKAKETINKILNP